MRPVDPRDQQWALKWPDYRVYFIDSSGSSFEYELRETDVVEVLEWAEAQKGQRTYVVYVCIPRDGLGLVRLAAEDPNDARQVAT